MTWLVAVAILSAAASGLVLGALALAGDARRERAPRPRAATGPHALSEVGVGDTGPIGDGSLLLQQQRSQRQRFRGFDRTWPPSAQPPLALPLMPLDGPIEPRPSLLRDDGSPFEFYFTRAAYSGYGTQGYASWSVDYPKADRQFLIGVHRLLNQLDAYSFENPILLTDPNLLRFPFLYAVEVGRMSLSEPEVEGLRRYLLSGGFLVIDDFWGTREWANLELELERILPGYPVVDVNLDHPIFHSFYDVEKLVQVPNVGLGRMGGETFEKDGYFPAVRGIFDDDDNLMVVINWNCDLGDAWEWAEDAYYPLEYSTYAYQMGVNFIVYAMTH